MSNTVSGELNSMSSWVTFKDRDGVTHVVLREHMRRNPYEMFEVLVDDGLHRKPIRTELSYDEIMGS